MKLALGIIMMAIQWWMIYHVTLHRPSWMRTWNLWSTLTVVCSLPWFLTALGLILSWKAS